MLGFHERSAQGYRQIWPEDGHLTLPRPEERPDHQSFEAVASAWAMVLWDLKFERVE